MVDWSLARNIARFAANASSTQELGPFDFASAAAEAEGQLREYTALEQSVPNSQPEPVGTAAQAGVYADSLAPVDVRFERGSAGGLPSLPNPQQLLERFREGGLVALVQTREQRRIFDSVQAVMSLIEGYSEHTMDAVGERVLPEYEGLREAMDRRRRSRSAPERVLQ